MVIRIILPNSSFNDDLALSSFKQLEPTFNTLLAKRKPRPMQKEIIGTLRKAIDDNFKYIWMQLPTGEGKSLDAMTIAEHFRNTDNKSYYLLSMNLGLTSQYRRDYPFLKEVRGRNNFYCQLHGYREKTADKAPCSLTTKKFICPKTSSCPYIQQRELATTSLGTLSTPYYIDRCCPGKYFQKRFLAIRDECHKLEKFYLQLFQETITTFNYNFCFPNSQFPVYDDPEFWRDEILQMDEILDEKINLTEDESELLQIESLKAKTTLLLSILSSLNNVVIDIEQTQKRGLYYALFRPVTVDKIAPNIIDNVAEHTIFMSGTILDIKQRTEDLGLNPDDVLYINKTTSNFKPENRPIVFSPQGSMSYKRRENTLPKVCDKTLQLLKIHKDQRGIIICGAHSIRSVLNNYLQRTYKPDLILTHDSNSASFQQSLDTFLDHQSIPYTFITTRYEGLDFPGKLAEYLIYVNLPFSPPMDKQTNARLLLEQKKYRENEENICNHELDEFNFCEKAIYCHKCRRWYDIQLAEAIQQAIGRIIRSTTDKGYIYFLDTRFKRFYNENEDLFLKYNQEAIIW